MEKSVVFQVYGALEVVGLFGYFGVRATLSLLNAFRIKDGC